jgi:uncharacterized tellurite resistance protein B-like protein
MARKAPPQKPGVGRPTIYSNGAMSTAERAARRRNRCHAFEEQVTKTAQYVEVLDHHLSTLLEVAQAIANDLSPRRRKELLGHVSAVAEAMRGVNAVAAPSMTKYLHGKRERLRKFGF